MAIPRVNQPNSFPQTGWPAVCNVAYSAAGGQMVAAPGVGKHIHVLGIISKNTASVSNGSVYMYIPGEGEGWKFPGAVDNGENLALTVTSNDDVTVFYYIWDEAKA